MVAIAHSIMLQSDGKIVVGGWVETDHGFDFAILRYDINGQLDSSFGINGKAVNDLGTASDECYSIVIQADDKIIAAGTIFPGLNGYSNFALIRYTKDGKTDSSFGV